MCVWFLLFFQAHCDVFLWGRFLNQSCSQIICWRISSAHKHRFPARSNPLQCMGLYLQCKSAPVLKSLVIVIMMQCSQFLPKEFKNNLRQLVIINRNIENKKFSILFFSFYTSLVIFLMPVVDVLHIIV